MGDDTVRHTAGEFKSLILNVIDLIKTHLEISRLFRMFCCFCLFFVFFT